MAKIKQDVTAKFKTYEGKLNKQKQLDDKVPKLEKTVAQVTDLMTDELCKNLKSISGELPNIQELESKVDLVQEGNDELEKSLGFLNEDMSSNKSDMEKLAGMIREQQKSINKLISENKKLKRKFVNLQELVNTIDNRQRKFNLIFEGVAENEKESDKQSIIDLLTKSKIGCDTAHVDSAYRLGKKIASKKRPILVSFTNVTTKDLILTKASEIKKQTQLPGLWINKDLSDASRIRTMEVRKCYNLMKQQKMKCKLSGATIEYNHRHYEHKDLHKLPEGCLLEDTQLVTCEDTNKRTSLCFQGSHAYVSNFYQTEIEYKDLMFISAEQAFQWAKATHCNDLCVAEKILEVDDPYVIKKLSEEIVIKNDWGLEEEQVLYEIVKQKFLQNQSLYN